jgi:hypothetical protein
MALIEAKRQCYPHLYAQSRTRKAFTLVHYQMQSPNWTKSLSCNLESVMRTNLHRVFQELHYVMCFIILTLLHSRCHQAKEIQGRVDGNRGFTIYDGGDIGPVKKNSIKSYWKEHISLSLSLSHTHTHTHTHNRYIQNTWPPPPETSNLTPVQRTMLKLLCRSLRSRISS